MAWARRRRRVRLHLLNDQPSIEGFLVGRADGHYRIAQADVLEAPGRTHPIDGEVYVPAARVAFYQVIG